MGDSNGFAGTWREARAKRALDRRMEPWLAKRRHLESLLAIAEAEDNGPSAARSWLGVQYAPGEQEVFSLRGVHLVEASRTSQQSQSGYVELGVSAPFTFKIGTQRGATATLPAAAATVDLGDVTITTKRVIFHGPRHTRVWEFRDLVGVETYPPQPVVYFHDRRKPKTGGLCFAARARAVLIEHLEVAIAVSRGEGRLMAADVRARLRAHDAERPDAPRQSRPAAPPTTIAPSAGLARRLGARVVDAFIYTLLFSVVAIGAAPYGSNGSAASWALLLAGALIVALETAFTYATFGTPGKRWARCAVVDERTGLPPTFGRALVRSTVMAVLCCTIIGALIDAAVALLEDGRSLHDQAAGTAVVHARR